MSSRDRSILAVVVLVIIAVAGYFVVVHPKQHEADQVQTQINAEATELSQAEAQVQAGLVAERQYRAYARQLKAITAAVPSDEQIPQLINELQAASNRNQVGFEALSVAASSTATPATAATPGTTAVSGTTTTSFPSQSFSLSFTGSYFAVADLLGTLDSFVRADDRHFKVSGRLISISAVSLAPGAGASGSSPATVKNGDVTASVTALDYDIPTALLSGSSATTATAAAP